MLPEAPGSLGGELAGVQDGDSFRLRLPTGQAVRVRIAGIDAPELGQPHADEARDALAALLDRGPLRLDAYKTDPFGRYVANVLTPDGDVGLAMVRAGHAWHFARYAREQAPADRRRHEEAQLDAQRARRGLWADARPVAPWDYRRRARGAAGR
ncbi:MAG: thermonuclease family protein [Burkholderiaceae bacterium]